MWHVLCSSQLFIDLSIIFLLLMSGLTSLWAENTLLMTSSLKLLRFALWPVVYGFPSICDMGTWKIHVFCYCCVKCSVNANWILFIDGFVQLFHIVFNFLYSSINCWKQVLKSPTIIMNVCYSTLFIDTYAFNTVVSSWWIDI